MDSQALAVERGVRSAPEIDDWRLPVTLNPALCCLSNSQRVLMLQGPVGPFFDRVGSWLQSLGRQVQRVVFQAGDEADCTLLKPIRFNRPRSHWSSFLAELLRKQRPDCIVLFGQNRYYHKVALERARAHDLPVVVMEEGYFRPGYVTMELWGVNGYSATLDRFKWLGDEAQTFGSHDIAPELTRMHFQKMAWHASCHYTAMKAGQHRYPHYTHHRADSLTFYASYWIRSWWRKGLNRSKDRKLQRDLFDSGAPYYFVPLQLEGDSQIVHHSPFADNSEFIVRVLPSFAKYAPTDAALVFRQHPHARGGPGNRALIQALADSLKVGNRVFHMCEGDTPDLAQHSLGTIVINSTVGLQALEREVPLIVLGDALYKQPALTFSGDLDAFWRESKKPDPILTRAFLAQVKNLTQAPASVYALRHEMLGWPHSTPELDPQHSVF